MFLTCWACENDGAEVGTKIFLPASASWPWRPAPQRKTSHLPPRCQSCEKQEHVTGQACYSVIIKTNKLTCFSQTVPTSGLDVAHDIICSSIPYIHLLLSCKRIIYIINKSTRLISNNHKLLIGILFCIPCCVALYISHLVTSFH